jgi:hypothetical protein
MPGKPAHIPGEKQALLDEIASRLSRIAGMAAMALGGSYASGSQHESSDLDIGLYYFESKPFSIEDVRGVAQQISVDGSPVVTGFYAWGAWVNGGAWIHTAQGKVDFLYRNIDQVQRTIDEARNGIVHHDYHQQPAHGFYSVIYLAETQICMPLYDPGRLIAALKSQVEIYPPKLKQTIVADSLWGAEFTLLHARGFAAQGDIYNTAGCLVRAAASLIQALFALNERYFMRDKLVMQAMRTFRVLPAGIIEQINEALACPGRSAQQLSEAVGVMEQAWRSVASLPEAQYAPKFQV